MSLRSSSLALAAAFALSAGIAAAQVPPAPPAANAPPAAAGQSHHGHGHRGMKRLLRSLNLTDAQKTQIQTIMQKYRTQDSSVTDPAQRRANAETEHNEILGVLTPDQRTKLNAELEKMHSEGTKQGAPPRALPPMPAPTAS